MQQIARARRLVESARELGEDAAALARLTRDLPAFVGGALSRQQVRERLAQRLATREQRFLAIVERAIYGHARSPYRQLLRHAGCERGDVKALVAREGVEGALNTLAAQGVYVTFEELKGRREAVRGSHRFTFQQRDFDNPLAAPHVSLQTSGSGGKPSRVRYPLAFLDEWAVSLATVFEAHGIESPRHAFWWPIPLIWSVTLGRIGQPSLAWFYPVHPLPPLAHIVSRYLHGVGRLSGVHLPLPQRCDLNDAERIVRWLADELRRGDGLVLWSTPSAAVRVGIAATRLGVDLRGLTLHVGGEPVTDARRALMTACGARVIVMYSFVEASGLTYSCAAPLATDDVHVMLDRFAVVQRRRPASVGGPDVDALLVTSLGLGSAKITLNAETGDYTRVEERACDCSLGSLGLRTHLSSMRSFEKLTGEGVTFARSNLLQILEEVLPAQFGGTSLDYQLVEEEAADSATRLVLRVNQSVGAVDESAVRAVLLRELGRDNLASQYQASLWRDAGTIAIRREAPLTTRVGKVLPFQLLKHTAAAREPR